MLITLTMLGHLTFLKLFVHCQSNLFYSSACYVVKGKKAIVIQQGHKRLGPEVVQFLCCHLGGRFQTMLLRFFKVVVGCVFDPSKVEHFWMIQHRCRNIFGKSKQLRLQKCIAAFDWMSWNQYPKPSVGIGTLGALPGAGVMELCLRIYQHNGVSCPVV